MLAMQMADRHASKLPGSRASLLTLAAQKERQVSFMLRHDSTMWHVMLVMQQSPATVKVQLYADLAPEQVAVAILLVYLYLYIFIPSSSMMKGRKSSVAAFFQVHWCH